MFEKCELVRCLEAYTLRPWPKKAGKERLAWRKRIAEGKHSPPPGADSEGDLMLKMACKDHGAQASCPTH